MNMRRTVSGCSRLRLPVDIAILITLLGSLQHASEEGLEGAHGVHTTSSAAKLAGRYGAVYGGLNVKTAGAYGLKAHLADIVLVRIISALPRVVVVVERISAARGFLE